MATFAIGTAPVLLALAGAPTLVKGVRKGTILRALGVVVIGFAVINATSALRLAGVDLTVRIGASAPQTVSGNVTAPPTRRSPAIRTATATIPAKAWSTPDDPLTG